jgi:DNA-binding transcriptional LysR family regulator
MTNFSRLDLNLLRVLDALLREGSTVGAGRRLGLSQPAVSAALGRLRYALDDPLFIRQGQGLVPTSFAAGLEERLRTLLDSLENVLAGPREFDLSKAQMDFRISGTDFFASMLMPKLATWLKHDARGVRLQMVDLVPDNYIEALEREAIDIALLPERSFPNWIAHEPLFYAEFAVIARQQHPALLDAGVLPGDVVPIDLFCALDHVLCSPDGHFHGIGDAALARAGHMRRVVMTVPVFEAVLQIVAASDMIALFPHALAMQRAQVSTLAIYAPPVQVPPPRLCMIWHRRHTTAPAHQWLRSIIRRVLAPLDTAGNGPDAS